MKISIITITFNVVDNIEHTINSVINQSYSNIEYIIIDGGSTDGTIEIINKYKNHIDIFITEKDNGIYDALNKGILNSSGEYIGFLHAGDVFYSDITINTLVNKIKVFLNIDIFYSNVLYVNNLNNLKIVRLYSSKYFFNFLFRFGFMPAHTSTFIKRNTYLTHKLYNINYRIAGDFDLLLRYMYVKKLNSKHIDIITTKMSIGGISSSGIKSIHLLNKEILNSLKDSNIYSNSNLCLHNPIFTYKRRSFLFDSD